MPGACSDGAPPPGTTPSTTATAPGERSAGQGGVSLRYLLADERDDLLAHVDRVLEQVGLGVGYPFQAAQVGRDFGRPLAVIRDYFEQMTAEQPMAPVPELSYPRILAASGPKMLALAADIADGAMSIFVPPRYTANARQVLGPDKLLVVGLTAAVDEDPDRARAAARRFVSETVARPGSPYALNLTRLGYAAQDISAASDEVTDAVTAWGSPERIAAAVREHLDAGADHVRLSVVAPDFQAGIGARERLAPALTASP